MKYQQSYVLKIGFFCLTILFLGLISASVTHAETYTFVAKWGSQGSGDGEFNYPDGVAVDSSDNVYVSDGGNHRIQRFDSNGNYLTQWGSYGNGDGQFICPQDIAFDSLGNIYVTDLGNHRVQKFSSSGEFITKWGSEGIGNGQFYCPRGIAVDSSSNIYVADGGNYRIEKFDSKGNYLTQWGSYGYGDGQFFDLSDVVVDSLGNVYATDLGNDRIQKFDSNGNYLAQWGSYGSGDGQFQDPTGIAVDSSGNVYVAEYTNDRIQKFDSNGNYLTQWDSYGAVDGEFPSLMGVALDSSGSVYVTDGYNNCIQKFSLKEKITPIITWNKPADIISGTPLSSTQLNAIAKDPTNGSSVSGSFTYTAEGTPIFLGTVLSEGMHTLQASFKPDDDTDYNTATASVSINVLTPVQGTQQLTATIQDLVTSGELDPEQSKILISKLDGVTKKLNNGDMKTAVNELNAFINQVEACIKSGKISSTEGQKLIDAANSVINVLKTN